MREVAPEIRMSPSTEGAREGLRGRQLTGLEK